MRTLALLAALGLLVMPGLSGCATPQPAAPGLEALPPDVPVLTRAQWGAADPVGPMRPHVPSGITVHHTGTPAQPDRPNVDKLRGLQAFSQREDTLADGSVKEAWADVPYHVYVAHDGTVLEGRDVRVQGDSNTDYDLDGQIQVVVEGNFEETAPTAAQLRSLEAVVVALAARWGLEADAVAGHGDRAPGQTVCPGAALRPVLPTLRAAVEASR